MTALPFDAGWTTATNRGNRGRGFAVALFDVEAPAGRHAVEMVSLIRRTVPDAAVHLASTINRYPVAADVYRLCQPPFACSVICLPWGDAVITSDWHQAISWATANGVLVFASVGNGTATTTMPAARPDVISCAACFTDGRLDSLGSPQTGRVDVGVFVGDRRSSGATAVTAAIAVQWMGAGGIYLFGSPSARLPGFRSWLALSGRPLPGGRGVVPNAGSL